MARSTTKKSDSTATPLEISPPTRGVSPQDKAASLFSFSPEDQARICPLLESLIALGNNPPVIPGSTMWKPKELAKWYAASAGLSALLNAALGSTNPWQAILTGGDSTKDDDQFQHQLVGTLEVIQGFVCPADPSPAIATKPSKTN